MVLNDLDVLNADEFFNLKKKRKKVCFHNLFLLLIVICFFMSVTVSLCCFLSWDSLEKEIFHCVCSILKAPINVLKELISA